MPARSPAAAGSSDSPSASTRPQPSTPSDDTSNARRPREPRLKLRIGDCDNTITLEFSLETARLRENSLFKVDTLIGSLRRFRDGLAAEAELAERRDG